MGRRGLLRFLAGVGLGAAGAELYERLYSVPSLRERFMGEVGYWMSRYNAAEEELKKTAEKVDSLNKVLSYQDGLEYESSSAISYYRQGMEEAISKLRNTVEKYRTILGDERVSFESASLKVLEDLNSAEKRLEKVLTYFPLIRNLSFSPSRVVNDKVYDLNVRLEVISPINTLEKVEVKLIPVEYEHFITRYGMRREDYNLVFPPEEVKTVRLQPKGLEQETFYVNFAGLKGGREYTIKSEVRDVVGNVRTEEIRTPYIREYENIAPLDDITVATFYYNWYSPNYYIPRNLPDKPLLGFYNSDDNIVFNKHVDWATGHGIDVFVFPWFFPGSEQHSILEKNMKADLFNQIKFSFISTFVDREGRQPPFNFDDPRVKQDFVDNISYIKDHYAKLPNFWKIDGKPVIVSWATHVYMSKTGNIREAFEKVGSNRDLYIFGEIASNIAIDEKFYPFLQAPVYGIYNYQTLTAPFHPWEMNKWPKKVNLSEILNDVLSIMGDWSEFAKRLNIEYFPTVSPGQDLTYDYRSKEPDPHPIILRDSVAFKALVDRVINFSKKKGIFITSFNEWFERTQIEPTPSYGLEYLKPFKGT